METQKYRNNKPTPGENILVAIAFIVFMTLLIVVSGCCVTKPSPETVTVRDSVVVRIKDSLNIIDKVVTRDSVVYIELPKEQSQNVVPTTMSSHLETSLAVSDAFVDTVGLLHHTLENKDTDLPAHVPVTEHTVITDQTHEKDSLDVHEDTHTEIEYVEKDLTKWQQFRLDAFWWLVGCFGLCLLVMFRKH